MIAISSLQLLGTTQGFIIYIYLYFKNKILNLKK
jgi:hypothetical protein